jgi:hypothetical protein
VIITGCTVQHAGQVLEQISGLLHPHLGFKLWRSRLPKPPAPAPPTFTGAVSVSAEQALANTDFAVHQNEKMLGVPVRHGSGDQIAVKFARLHDSGCD